MKTIPYLGGKRAMLPQLLPILESIPHDAYAEAFGGSMVVMANKEPKQVELANDQDVAAINFFLACAHCPEKLGHAIAGTPLSDHMFEDLRKALLSFRKDNMIMHYVLQDGESFAKHLQAAVAFYYVNAMSFKNNGSAFMKYGARNMSVEEIMQRCFEISERLRGVTFISRDSLVFLDYLQKNPVFDMNALCYLDPPYPDSATLGNGSKWKMQDFTDLLDKLREANFQWVLSSYPGPELQSYIDNNGWDTLDITGLSGAAGNQKIEKITSNVMFTRVGQAGLF